MRNRESQMPGLPVHSVLYGFLLIELPIIIFLKILKVGAETVVAGRLFHSLIVVICGCVITASKSL